MIEYSYDPPYNHWSGNRSDTLNKWKINYKGSIATASALPEKGDFKGDTYNVLEDGSNYMWNGKSWDKLDANTYVGATSNKDGIQGLVPQPDIADRGSFLCGNGNWKVLDASDIKTGVFDSARIPLLPILSDIYLDADNGDDTNDGLTANTAVKTIDAALDIIKLPKYKSSTNITLYFKAATNNYGIIKGVANQDITLDFENGTSVNAISASGSERFFVRGTVTCFGAVSAYRGGILTLASGLNITFKNVTSDCFCAFANGLIYKVNNATLTINLDSVVCASGSAVLTSKVSSCIYLQGGNETWTGSFTGDFYHSTLSSTIIGAGTPSIAVGATGTIDETSIFN